MSDTGNWDETAEQDGEGGAGETANGLSGLVEMVLRAVQNAFIYGYRVRFLHSMAYQLATVKTQTGLAELLGKVWKSVRMGVDHGKVLAFFAVVYRCVLVLVKRVRQQGLRRGQQSQLSNHFVAGFVGGVLIYGGLLQRAVRRKTGPASGTPSSPSKDVLRTLLALNEGILTQITMYTMSRLIIAGGRDLARVVVDMKGAQDDGSSSNNSRRRRLQRQSRESDIGAVASVSWVLTCGLVWGGIMVYYQRDRRQGSAPGQGGHGQGHDRRLLYLPRALQVSLEFIYGGVRHAWREAFDYNSR